MYADVVDRLANNMGHKIEIFHIATGRSVFFKAWVTDFSDSYQSNWSTEDTYGRMDPIATFQNTRRTINITWDVLAGNVDEARKNQVKCQMLFSMLYPSYEDSETGDSVGNILQAPMLKVKFSNLITDPTSWSASGVGEAAKDAGLLGFFNGFDYTPDFDAGVFNPEPNRVYPKLISLSGEFQVLHQFPVGWDSYGGFRKDMFAYGHTHDQSQGQIQQQFEQATGVTPADEEAGQSLPDPGGMSLPPGEDADGEPTWTTETPDVPAVFDPASIAAQIALGMGGE